MHALRSLTIAALGGLLCWSTASAHDLFGNLSIEQPWARATMGQAKVGAVYMTLSVQDRTDRLVAMSLPLADRAELHTHIMEGDIVKMRRIEELEISPGEPTVLRPGSHHVMLMGLTKPLVEGQTFPLTLTFAQAGTVTIDVIIEAPTAMEPSREME